MFHPEPGGTRQPKKRPNQRYELPKLASNQHQSVNTYTVYEYCDAKPLLSHRLSWTTYKPAKNLADMVRQQQYIKSIVNNVG
jgi:hypothetical protein